MRSCGLPQRHRHEAEHHHKQCNHGQHCARRIERPLLFNTWIGLVHHYLVNRDVFATGDSVIAEQGENLVNHFMTLVKP